MWAPGGQGLCSSLLHLAHCRFSVSAGWLCEWKDFLGGMCETGIWGWERAIREERWCQSLGGRNSRYRGSEAGKRNGKQPRVAESEWLRWEATQNDEVCQASRAPIMPGLEDPVREFGFHSKNNGNPLKVLSWHDTRICLPALAECNYSICIFGGGGGRHGVGWDRVIHMVSSCAWICPLWPICSLLGVEYQIPSKPIVLGSYKSIHITILPLLSCSLMFWYLASSVWPRWETSLLKQGPELPFLGWW